MLFRSYKLKDGDKYTYSPVWVFAQCDKMEDGSLDKDYPIQLIMLDATTGDMIDLKDVLNQQTYDSSVVDSVIDSDSDFDISDDSLIDETDITDTDDADSSDESSADAIDIGDADIDMESNTHLSYTPDLKTHSATLRRVEVATPIYDDKIKQRIRDMFGLMMKDNMQARIQQPDGTYLKQNRDVEEINSQEIQYADAYERARQ